MPILSDLSCMVGSASVAILSVSPTSQSFASLHDGEVDVNNKQCTIENTGTATLNWTANSDVDWLCVNNSRYDLGELGKELKPKPVSGSLEPSATVAITLVCEPNLSPPLQDPLEAGDYTGTVSVTSNGGNQNVALSVHVRHVIDMIECTSPGFYDLAITFNGYVSVGNTNYANIVLLDDGDPVAVTTVNAIENEPTKMLVSSDLIETGITGAIISDKLTCIVATNQTDNEVTHSGEVYIQGY